jgi:hypothetical protein
VNSNQKRLELCTPQNAVEAAELDGQRKTIDELFGREIAEDKTLVAEDLHEKHLAVAEKLREYIILVCSLYGNEVGRRVDRNLLVSAFQAIGVKIPLEEIDALVGDGTAAIFATRIIGLLPENLLEALQNRDGAGNDGGLEALTQMSFANEPAPPEREYEEDFERYNHIPANNGFFARNFGVIATIVGVSVAIIIYYLYFIRKRPVSPLPYNLA